MPSRNARPYLQDAVQSVLAQDVLSCWWRMQGQRMSAWAEAFRGRSHQRIVSKSDESEDVLNKFFAQRGTLIY